MAVPAREELFERLLDRKRVIYNSFSNQIKNERKRLTSLQTFLSTSISRTIISSVY